jgi:hypothetical protein
MDKSLNHDRRARRVFLALALPLVLLYAALATPGLGLPAFEWLAQAGLSRCGRTIDGFIEGPCYLNGQDAAGIYGGYYGSSFVGGLLDPLIALSAIRALVPEALLYVWIGAAVASGLWALIAQRIRRRALAAMHRGCDNA